MRKEAFSDSVGSSPAEFSKFLDDERAKWSAVIKKANIKIQ
jgi:tripartite-type tricarboxylate transporter receptor subunit TctC